MAYARQFLEYIGEKRKIKQILYTEFTTKKGRHLYLDFLCELEDGTLLNIEFQFTGPNKDDFERFYDYNIYSETEHDSRCESIVISFKSHNTGRKTRKIGKTKTMHPKIFYLGDIDFEKILNNIECKAIINLKLTNAEEISLLLMSLIPKYKNKKEMLERICKIHKKEYLFDKTKINTFKAIIELEIKNLLSEHEREKFKGEINMTPEAEEMINTALNQVRKKHMQLAKEEGIEEGIEKGIEEGKKEVAKKLKKLHSPEEISKITGLTQATIAKL